jgi:hypothetical protein
MGEITEIAERRTHKRFPAKERALVSLRSDAYGMLLYHLIEISNGGLSFRYLREDVLINGSSELSIVIEDNYYMTEIPVETVSDSPLVNSYIPFRRRGLRFGELSPMQKSQLNDFIMKSAY